MVAADRDEARARVRGLPAEEDVGDLLPDRRGVDPVLAVVRHLDLPATLRLADGRAHGVGHLICVHEDRALDVPGGAGEEAEIVHAERDLVDGDRRGLADVPRLEPPELLGVLLHEVGEPMDERVPLVVAHRGPRTLVERLAGGSHGPVGVGLAAARCRACRLAQRESERGELEARPELREPGGGHPLRQHGQLTLLRDEHAVLADEPGVRRVSELPRDAVEPGDAVPRSWWFRTTVRTLASLAMRPTSIGVECVSATCRKMFSGLPASAAAFARAMLSRYVPWSMTSHTNTSAPLASFTMFSE